MSTDPSKFILYGVEKGTLLVDGEVTQNRAACFGLHEAGYPFITEAGYKFLKAEIDWILTDPDDPGSDVLDNCTESPTDFNLAQNYPNPFNPTTTVEFSLAKKSNVKLEVFDIAGRSVVLLMRGVKEAGNYSIQFNGSNLSSGCYVCKLTVNNTTLSRKMLLMK